MRWLHGFLLVLGLSGPVAALEPETIYDFDLTAIEGDELALESFRGQPMLIVNTASLCAFTHQYRDLQALWDAYREEGLIVIGVPSNDFGRQEPGSNDEIKEFCDVNFAIDFPMSEREIVRGEGSHGLFDFLRDRLGESAGPEWNFYKYLVDRNGNPVTYWPSSTPPNAPELVAAVNAALGKDG